MTDPNEFRRVGGPRPASGRRAGVGGEQARLLPKRSRSRGLVSVESPTSVRERGDPERSVDLNARSLHGVPRDAVRDSVSREEWREATDGGERPPSAFSATAESGVPATSHRTADRRRRRPSGTSPARSRQRAGDDLPALDNRLGIVQQREVLGRVAVDHQ